jgi:hypothetical protein
MSNLAKKDDLASLRRELAELTDIGRKADEERAVLMAIQRIRYFIGLVAV